MVMNVKSSYSHKLYASFKKFCGHEMFLLIVVVLVFFFLLLWYCVFLNCHGLGIVPYHHVLGVPLGCYALVFLLITMVLGSFWLM
jgi:hypothetical protein